MKNIHDKGSKFKKEKLEPKSNHAMFIFPVISAKYLDVDRWTEMIDMLNNGYTIVNSIAVGTNVIYIIKS